MLRTVAVLAVGACCALAQTPITQAAGQSSQHEMRMGDKEFAHLMAKHHQGGIEMAQLEEKAGASAEAKGLATKIRTAQQSELPKLQAHGKGVKMAGMVAEHEKQMQKEHMATMTKLKGLKGAELDKAFADEMIKHHQSALQMIAQSDLKDATLKELADKMSANQKQEILELQKIK